MLHSDFLISLFKLKILVPQKDKSLAVLARVLQRNRTNRISVYIYEICYRNWLIEMEVKSHNLLSANWSIRKAVV